jgi:hypothetical protein
VFDVFCSGLCCEFGYGSVTITNSDGDSVWTHEGGYGAFHSVIIHVHGDGEITTSDDQDAYISPGAIISQGNLRSYARDPAQNDPLWPGIYPDYLNHMVVNVKLDMYPKVCTEACMEYVILARLDKFLNANIPSRANKFAGNKLGSVVFGRGKRLRRGRRLGVHSSRTGTLCQSSCVQLGGSCAQRCVSTENSGLWR